MLLLLGFMAFLANGDNYAAAPLLLNIAKDLNLSVETAAISVTAYMLAFGAFTLIFGPLSDRFGKAKVINIAAMGTAVFSILGGFAYNLPSLIIFRAVNGAFGAGIFPVTMALVGQSFDDQNRHKALGKVMGLMFLGGATATAVGGVLAYYGSWRLVYIFYGIGELILALFMLKMLEKDASVVSKLNFISAYKEPLSNFKFMRLVLTIFFVGFSVFGTFTYSGKLLQQITGYEILVIGLILSLFGVGTVIGGRIAPKIRKKTGALYFIMTGVIGFIALFALSASSNIYLLCAGLFFFGISFIFFQSTLVSAAQEILPKMRGTAMSVASFNMFVGGAVGTSVNAKIISSYGIDKIYLIASVLMLIVGIATSFFLKRKPEKKVASL
ncbi:MAG TPA: MFS transporter [Oscillospiraceae bacterium]|nr:MFS transporter [Oscillospiraceae bacterium]HPF55600.1 MFS transporter [Clostridiales bacterium]HPK35835.1 MFS transporter [Oscillospiraceae bacterium]HPR76000.1 MFS transporter [Oscillospiraceae bacterium]